MELSAQVYTFLLIMATGIFLGVLFDTYRVMRGYFRPRWLITSVADLLYWLVAAGIAFLALLFGNWGELRFYVFIAMLTGVIAYYRLVSRHALKLIATVLTLVARVWRTAKLAVVYTVVKPLAFAFRASLFPFRYTGRRYSAWHKKRFPPPPPPDETPPQ